MIIYETAFFVLHYHNTAIYPESAQYLKQSQNKHMTDLIDSVERAG